MEKAPFPKRGKLKMVFEVVNALGGATEYEVFKYVPACTNTKKLTRKQVRDSLSYAVSRGYLIRDTTSDKVRYFVATLDHYNARVELINKQPSRKKHKNKLAKVPGEALPHFANLQPPAKSPDLDVYAELRLARRINTILAAIIVAAVCFAAGLAL